MRVAGIHLYKGLIVVFRVENKAVIGENKPVGISFSAGIVAVTLVVFSASGCGQQFLIVAESITADGHTRRHVGDIVISTVPAKLLRFFFCDKVVRKGEIVRIEPVGDRLRINDGSVRNLRIGGRRN